MNLLETFLEVSSHFVWNWIALVLVVIGGIFLSVRFRFLQIFGFCRAWSLLFASKREKGSLHLSRFQAMSAALSGTIGVGNIAGVSIAISLAGPGTVFWMWVMAIIGMIVKYAEAILGIRYRIYDPTTKMYRGGPMYFIEKGLGSSFKWMALWYAVCVSIGSLGWTNMFQSNQTAQVFSQFFSVPLWITGLFLLVVVALTIVAGIQRIASVATKIMPLMGSLYIFSALFVCLIYIEYVPVAFQLIFKQALSWQTVAAGSLGSLIAMGFRRAIFSSSAGVGDAAIAYATIDTKYPEQEGLVASLGPFLDTIVLSTMTGLVVLIAHLSQQPNIGNLFSTPYIQLVDQLHLDAIGMADPLNKLEGVAITLYAFSQTIGKFGYLIVGICVLLFSFTTMITYYYYGESGFIYLVGYRYTKWYKLFFIFLTFVGAIVNFKLVLHFSDLMCGLMVIPNLIGIMMLALKRKI